MAAPTTTTQTTITAQSPRPTSSCSTHVCKSVVSTPEACLIFSQPVHSCRPTDTLETYTDGNGCAGCRCLRGRPSPSTSHTRQSSPSTRPTTTVQVCRWLSLEACAAPTLFQMTRQDLELRRIDTATFLVAEIGPKCQTLERSNSGENC